MTVYFRVFGQPQPKGSTRAFVRKMGDHYRAVTTSDNPSLAKWEQVVRFEAQTALRLAKQAACPFFDGAVLVEVAFGLVRPPSVSVKKRPLPIVKPDVDKLLRAAIDALSGVLFRDDCQVVKVVATKQYLITGPAFADIRVSEFVPSVPSVPSVSPSGVPHVTGR